MNPLDFWNALQLPKECLHKEIVPKRLLIEHGNKSSGDRSLLMASLGEVRWVASLQAANCAVPFYEDSERKVDEIQCLQVELKDSSKLEYIVELVHRAMPYPLVLCMHSTQKLWVSLASKRMSLSEKEAWVLDQKPWTFEVTEPLQNWALAKQDRKHLWGLYQSWLGQVQQSMHAVSGPNAERLRELNAQVDSLKRQVRKAILLKDQADLNLQIESLCNEIAVLKSNAWLRPERERLDHALQEQSNK